jgi:hypothetical protein
MGSSISCSKFEELSRALQYILINIFGMRGVTHILDDFMFVAHNAAICQKMLNMFLQLAAHLNIPINKEKTVVPSKVAVVHGIEVNTTEMIARLPMDKIHNAIDKLKQMYHKQKIKLVDIQSLIGVLNFACKVIKPGRAFLRRLTDLTLGIKKPHHFIKVTKAARLDIKAWLVFLENYNGITVLSKQIWQTSHHLQLYTDASSLHGFGIVFGSNWTWGKWPPQNNFNINILEMYPVVLALLLWPQYMENKCILIFSDNKAVCDIINKQTTKCKLIMALVRKFVMQCLKYNILFRAKHISGKLNVTADLLSRLQIQKALQTAPYLCHHPRVIPADFQLSQLLFET